MFTLRFEAHDPDRYVVYGCESYHVGHEASSEKGHSRVVRMFRHLHDDNPYFEQVGDTEPYGVVYVTNLAGKTIDTIR